MLRDNLVGFYLWDSLTYNTFDGRAKPLGEKVGNALCHRPGISRQNFAMLRLLLLSGKDRAERVGRKRDHLDEYRAVGDHVVGHGDAARHSSRKA